MHPKLSRSSSRIYIDLTDEDESLCSDSEKCRKGMSALQTQVLALQKENSDLRSKLTVAQSELGKAVVANVMQVLTLLYLVIMIQLYCHSGRLFYDKRRCRTCCFFETGKASKLTIFLVTEQRVALVSFTGNCLYSLEGQSKGRGEHYFSHDLRSLLSWLFRLCLQSQRKSKLRNL